MTDRLKFNFRIKKTGMRQIFNHFFENASVFNSNFPELVRFWFVIFIACQILNEKFVYV